MPDTSTRASFWKRLLVGTLLVVVASAGATAATGFREIERFLDLLREGEALDLGDELAEAEAGDPQTIMLIGSDRLGGDKRKNDENEYRDARSDTLMLVRLDPSQGSTALMSLPRDLKVEIPGYGTDKLNAAYSLGGPKLTLQTVKQLTGLRINHVVNVDFTGFAEAVDQLGCVYVDVDRRYYNVSSEFAPIDLHQGYQKLCGPQSLAYVRFRHEDNDLVRSARQQDFLRQAKQQIGFGRLFSDREELIKIVGRSTNSDIEQLSRASVLSLLKLVLASATLPVREVQFQADLGQSYVTADPDTIDKLARDFLGAERSDGAGGRNAAGGTDKRAGSKPPREQREVSLEDASAEGIDQARQAEALGAEMPLYYPRVRQTASVFAGEPRVYKIGAPDEERYEAYRMVLNARPGDVVGEYYGVQGTTWKEPPILEDPSETRTIDGRKFELHFDGERVRLVAWRTDKGVYWISNGLLQTLSEREMLEIASSTKAL